jgi:hypothetical protein
MVPASSNNLTWMTPPAHPRVNGPPAVIPLDVPPTKIAAATHVRMRLLRM